MGNRCTGLIVDNRNIRTIEYSWSLKIGGDGMKRFLALILSLVLVASLMGCAADEKAVDDYMETESNSLEMPPWGD